MSKEKEIKKKSDKTAKEKRADNLEKRKDKEKTSSI